jgi:hypothetical protein
MNHGIFCFKITYDGNKELFLPIFNEDRVFVYSVLTDSLERWKRREKKHSVNPFKEFYDIANALARERKNEFPVFIGPEAITYESLESVINDRPFVFTVDFENEKIVTLK